jgi:2-oxoglutarate/2-oxoacid ferredoxin oxidoreductase subunit alpha
VFGGESGELLVIGWGSTKGAIEEAVERLREDGYAVSSLHLTFLQPMAPGLKQVMQRFDKVMTIEGNWCDRADDTLVDASNRRYSALAMLLRSRYLIDVDCWSEVKGQPIKPNTIRRVLFAKLRQRGGLAA